LYAARQRLKGAGPLPGPARIDGVAAQVADGLAPELPLDLPLHASLDVLRGVVVQVVDGQPARGQLVEEADLQHGGGEGALVARPLGGQLDVEGVADDLVAAGVGDVPQQLQTADDEGARLAQHVDQPAQLRVGQ
jgi:hypothetical protein